jgi:hypothetical protein
VLDGTAKAGAGSWFAFQPVEFPLMSNFCTKPAKGWLTDSVKKDGSPGQKLVFKRPASRLEAPILIPCRKCLHCKQAKGLSWGYRIMHEALLHDFCTFVTLTEDDAHHSGKLDKKMIQKFLHRFRKWLQKQGYELRYALVGEHGEKTKRGHYHLMVFGVDLTQFGVSRSLVIGGDAAIHSVPHIEKLWGRGLVHVKPFIPEQAMYLGMHSVKAFLNDTPSFMLVSKVPGIGRGWIEKYLSDFDKGFATRDGGIKYSIPKHYLDWLCLKERLEPLKASRQKFITALPKEQREESEQTAQGREVNLRAKLALRRTGAKF